MQFQAIASATLKAKKSDSTEMLSIHGITASALTPENAATQSNKLLDVVGWAIVADNNMTRTITQEAIDE